MKTRSQTKKEKLESQKPKIPRLNEDILGIILDHVIRKEQRKIKEAVFDIEEHFILERPGLSMDEEITVMSRTEGIALDHVIWPDYMDSNSRRLINHTQVKLFPNRELSIHQAFSFRVTTKRELDTYWKVFKNFGLVIHRFRDGGRYEELDAAAYIRKLWTTIQERQTSREWLIKKLEKMGY